MKNKKGFTLVELLAVIVILGVLLLVAVPAISNVQKSAKIDSLKNGALMVVKAYQNWETLGKDEGKAFSEYYEGSICTMNGTAIADGQDNCTTVPTGDSTGLTFTYRLKGYELKIVNKSITLAKAGITAVKSSDNFTGTPKSKSIS